MRKTMPNALISILILTLAIVPILSSMQNTGISGNRTYVIDRTALANNANGDLSSEKIGPTSEDSEINTMSTDTEELVTNEDDQGNVIVYTGEWTQNTNGTMAYINEGEFLVGLHEIEPGKTYYFNPEGVMQTGWVMEEGYWYLFDTTGLMQTGWQKVDNKSYYLNEDGTMAVGLVSTGGAIYFLKPNGEIGTGWQLFNGKWYLMNSEGIVQIGWQKVSNKSYYFNEDGTMAVGLVSTGGAIYFLKPNGEIGTGWQLLSSKWYYMNAGGVVQTGWRKINNKWYFFNQEGTMQTGWISNGGYWYLLNSSGAMLTGWQKVSGVWYYLKSSGAMATGWQKLAGKWYYLRSNGSMSTGWEYVSGKWYFMNSNGTMFTGWRKYAGSWYYMKSGGDMAIGWQKLSGAWYFLNSSGAMATGWMDISGKSYYFKASGIWDPNAKGNVKAKSITLAYTSTYVYAKKPWTLKATLVSASSTPANEAITWSSSNNAIATVDNKGAITGHKYGTTTITAKTASGAKATCKITVYTLNRTISTAVLTPGTQIDAFTKYGTPPGMKCTSSNSAVASVTNTGRVTADIREGGLKTGTTTITATTSDGESISMTVKVIDVPTIVDVSVWQGDIDWAKASKSIDLAILRVSDGDDYIDRLYPEYAKACQKYGVPYGAYQYARYKTAAQAKAHAKLFYEKSIVNGKKPTFYVVDCEDSFITRANTQAFITELRRLAGANTKVGAYVANHLYKQLNLDLRPGYNMTPDFVWVPLYSSANLGTMSGVTQPSHTHDMWQYSSGGRIPGISGRVDMNTIYTANGSKISNRISLQWLSTP